MEEKIKEIQEYFIGKIIAGEFEVSEIAEYTVTVLIDGKYKFVLWIANGQPHLNTVAYHSDNFMQLSFSEKQRKTAWKHFETVIKDYKEKTLIREKRKQYEALKKELGIAE